MKFTLIILLIILFLLYIYNKSNIEKFNNQEPKVAYISAIYGNYEITCKKFVKQTIPSDFICFTNSTNIIENNGWIIDNTPYHNDNPNPIDNNSYINSLSNNKHTFNIAKYYKQSFHLIPRLKKYDYIIWLDGTIEITSDNVSAYIIKLFNKNNIDLISWDHVERKGLLKFETDASNFYRYTSTFWFNQHQPYQDVNSQYDEYIKQGYDDKKWTKGGVWVTCFVAYKMSNPTIIPFLDFWYKQTLQYTTQDQIGFPFAMQKMNMKIYTLPDNNIKGDASTKTDIYIKHNHGK